MKITNISFVYNYFHIFLYTHFLLGTWKLNVKSMILSFRSKLLQLSYSSSFSRSYFSLSPTGSCWSWKCSPFSHCWIIFPPHPWLSSTLIINQSSPPTLPSLKAFRYCQQCFLKHFSGKNGMHLPATYWHKADGYLSGSQIMKITSHTPIISFKINPKKFKGKQR